MSITRRLVRLVSIVEIVLLTACATANNLGAVENFHSQPIDELLKFDNLDVRLVSLTRDRNVSVERNDYSTMLKPEETWLVLNLDVLETQNRATRLLWKNWFRVRTETGEILAPELAIVPANEEIGAHKREMISILFRLRRSDFPVLIFDEERRIERKHRG